MTTHDLIIVARKDGIITIRTSPMTERDVENFMNDRRFIDYCRKPDEVIEAAQILTRKYSVPNVSTVDLIRHWNLIEKEEQAT